jgi:aspartate racemase
LRLVIVGGEKASAAVLEEWQKAAGGRVRWLNTYGPTEATVIATAHEPAAGAAGEVPIGRPIANARVYLLDAHLRPVPIGLPGELCIGGAGVARGYLDRPELTAEKFIPDPFGAGPGGRLYRTGDLARWRPDGTVEFLGRTDDQLKIRGYRVELAEIEAALGQHPQVREAVVVAWEPAPGDKRLAAYVVARGAPAPATTSLRDFLRGKLPAYMVPAAFVPLAALPKTPNGKVDRKALPAPQTAAEADAPRTLPRNEEEKELLRIWEEVLGVKPLGVRDNFFEVGGNSLLAVRVFAAIHKSFGRELPVTALFQSPTVEELAKVLHPEVAFDPTATVQVLNPRGTRRPLFVVHGGQDSWAMVYRHLAGHLGADQPLYILLPPRLAEGAVPYRRVEEAAAHHLREIRRVQPEGPYLLAGYCLGGIETFEIAQQLRAGGERIGLVAMVDTVRPDFRYYVRRFVRRSLHHLKVAFRRPSLQSVTYLSQKTHVARRLLLPQLRRQLQGLARRVGGWFGLAKPQPTHTRAGATVAAVVAYKPKVYPGKIDLFIADLSTTRHKLDRRFGWCELAAEGCEVHRIPADHPDVVRPPYVGLLAEKLRHCLDKVGR